MVGVVAKVPVPDLTPSPDDINAACQSLQDLLRQLQAIARVGGAAPSLGLLSAAADDCPDAVIVCDRHASILMVNGAAARLTGYSTRELQSMTVWDITHATSQSDFDVLWREFLRAGRQRGIYTLRSRSGESMQLAYCAQDGVLDNLNMSVLRKPSR